MVWRGKASSQKCHVFLCSGREYALNFKEAWNQMEGSCCAKKQLGGGGD